MALSASELLQLQQSLTQLAKASSNIASFATQLGNVQNTNISSVQTETKYRRTVIDDYDSLSKTLKNQTKEFKDVLKHVNDFSESVTNIKKKHDSVSDRLSNLQAAIAAAGIATTYQTLRQSALTTKLNQYSEQLTKESNLEKSRNISGAVIDLVQSSAAAAKYRSEYEKDFYGRQLATEIKSSLANITNAVGGKFGNQLLELTDVSQIAKFANAQDAAIQSLINNNKKLDDSNADTIKQYVELGKSLGYTSTEFDFLAAHLGARTTGTTIDISQSSFDSLITAQETIATVINDSNEKLSQTLDRDLKSFGGQFNAYMHENRNGFEKLIYELRDINTRRGSLTTGQGRDEAADALHSAVGMLGREVIPKMTEMLKTMGNYYTSEYDALTNFVQTNRLTALQLNMTEEQYRQSRAESKATWNLAAQSGQEQLDEFLTSRRRSLEAVYGTEPMLRDKMGTQFYNLINVLGSTQEQADGMVKEFGNLSLTSRMSSVELTELFTNIVNSNDNLKVMNSLDERGRQIRIQEIKNATTLVSKLGLVGEAADQFAKVLTDMPSKAESVTDLMGEYGSAQVLFNQMNNMAQTLGTTLNLSRKDMIDLIELRMASKMAPLTPDQQAQETALASKYTQAKMDLEKARLDEAARLREMGGTHGEVEGLKLSQQLKMYTQEFEKAADLSDVAEPLENQALAMEKYNATQGKLITSTDELKKAFDRQADLAKQRADEIKMEKTITGAATEATRFVEGAKGNMWTELAGTAGGVVLGGGLLRAAPAIAEILGPMMLPIAASASSLILPALGVLAAGGALYAGYKALSSEEEPNEESKIVEPVPETLKRIEPVAETPKEETKLPSKQVTAASDAAASSVVLTEQFTKYFNSVDAQNTVIAAFLRTMVENSTVLGKDIKEWYQKYQDIHPIIAMEDQKQDKSSKDATAK